MSGWRKRQVIEMALYGITKVPTLTHGVLVKLSDVESVINTLAQPEPVPQEFVDIAPQGQGEDYERGFVDGMQRQMRSSVDRAVNRMAQRTWVGLTDEEIKAFDTWHDNREEEVGWVNPSEIVAYISERLRSKNT